MSSTVKNIFIPLLACLALTGCVSAPAIGTAPSAIAPKIIIDPNDSKNRVWDNPGAFGPVPAADSARGAKTCSTLDKDGVQFKAAGFHPKAQNIDGKPFDGGGFYCVPI